MEKTEKMNDCRSFVENNKKMICAVGIIAGSVALGYLGYKYIPKINLKVIENEEMIFDYVTESWLDNANEAEIRSTLRKMRIKLHELDHESEEYKRIFSHLSEVLSTISKRFPSSLPTREHGWYLQNDD